VYTAKAAARDAFGYTEQQLQEDTVKDVLRDVYEAGFKVGKPAVAIGKQKSKQCCSFVVCCSVHGRHDAAEYDVMG
jgi:hypothetical protein